MNWVRLSCMFVLMSGLFVCMTGCGTPQVDASVLTINPSVVRVKVNQVTTVQIFFTKPRENDGQLEIFVDDQEIVAPATTTAVVEIKAGEDSVSFDIQGVKPGQTNVKARLDKALRPVTVPVIVSNQ